MVYYKVLQSITKYTKYYKVRWIYYKLRQVLHSAMVITNCDSTEYLSLFVCFLTEQRFQLLIKNIYYPEWLTELRFSLKMFVNFHKNKEVILPFF